jgi:hypothetical protein
VAPNDSKAFEWDFAAPEWPQSNPEALESSQGTSMPKHPKDANFPKKSFILVEPISAKCTQIVLFLVSANPNMTSKRFYYPIFNRDLFDIKILNNPGVCKKNYDHFLPMPIQNYNVYPSSLKIFFLFCFLQNENKSE